MPFVNEKNPQKRANNLRFAIDFFSFGGIIKFSKCADFAACDIDVCGFAGRNKNVENGCEKAI